MLAAATVLVACHDLMSRSSVEATLRRMGLAPVILRAPDDPAVALAEHHPGAVIVDLALAADRWRAIVTAARASHPPVPILAFGPHVDREAFSAARAAGCDIVVANSRMARELALLVDRLVTPRDER